MKLEGTSSNSMLKEGSVRTGCSWSCLVSKDPTASLSNLFQCLTTLRLREESNKKPPLMFKCNFPSSTLFIHPFGNLNTLIRFLWVSLLNNPSSPSSRGRCSGPFVSLGSSCCSISLSLFYQRALPSVSHLGWTQAGSPLVTVLDATKESAVLWYENALLAHIQLH